MASTANSGEEKISDDISPRDGRPSAKNAAGRSDLACYWKDMWQKLNTMRQMWQLCDVTLFSADNAMFMAHSPVLAASSEVFHNFFVTKTTNLVKEIEGQNLLVPNMKSDVLQITLEFIYGNMPANETDFEKLKEGANVLGLHGALSFLDHTRGKTQPPSVCPMSRSRTLSQLAESTSWDSEDHNSKPVIVIPETNLQKMYLANVPKFSHKLAEKNVKQELSEETGHQPDGNDTDDDAQAMLYPEKPVSLSAEPKCPFSGLSGTNPHGPDDPLLGDAGLELLTEVSLVDMYPQLLKKRGKPPKKLAKLLHEQQQLQEIQEREAKKNINGKKRKKTKCAKGNDGECEKVSETSSDEWQPNTHKKKIGKKRTKCKKQAAKSENGVSKQGNGPDKYEEIEEDSEEENESIISSAESEHQQSTDKSENDTDNKEKSKRKRLAANMPIDEEAEKENAELAKQLKWSHAAHGKREYVCMVEGCGYANNKLDYLQSHMHHRHSIGRPSKLCPQCDHAYFSPNQLHTHMRRSHAKVYSGKSTDVLCPDCGSVFTNNQALHIHQLKAHEKGKLFTCNDCNFKSPRKKDMQSHMLAKHNKVAPGVRVFDCRYCDYRCLDRNRHLEHEAKHTGEQKYLCPICGKAYTTRRGMRTHVKYHSDDRPHVCNICEAKFKVRAKLTDHIKLMHTQQGLKPFQCAYCPHATALRGNCNQHVKKYHLDMPVVVIDLLAHERKFTRDYNYSNFQGKNIEQTKDVAAAAWASVGNTALSENEVKYAAKPETLNPTDCTDSAGQLEAPDTEVDIRLANYDQIGKAMSGFQSKEPELTNGRAGSSTEDVADQEYDDSGDEPEKILLQLGRGDPVTFVEYKSSDQPLDLHISQVQSA